MGEDMGEERGPDNPSESGKATGLQKSMRFLLQVIAGLLLGAFITNSIRIAEAHGGVTNNILLISAGVFLFRLFVDNLLFYETSDQPVQNGSEYFVRLILLALDVMSYVVCYRIVYRLGLLPNKATIIYAPWAVVLLAQGVALVEFLHFLWSVGALGAEEKWHSGKQSKLFARWAILSGVTCTAMLIVSCQAQALPPLSAAVTFAIASGVSLVAYLIVMQEQYREIVR